MTCKRIAKLLSEQQEHPLSFWRRAAIRIHLSWCVFCRRLASQLEFIHGVSRAIGSSIETDAPAFDAVLSPEAKTRIKQDLARRIS
jgi:uncharacterized membrane protein